MANLAVLLEGIDVRVGTNLDWIVCATRSSCLVLHGTAKEERTNG
jgi:hypothetical protein